MSPLNMKRPCVPSLSAKEGLLGFIARSLLLGLIHKHFWLTVKFPAITPATPIWSSLTVIRPARAVSLRRSAERLAGAVIGCVLGLGAVQALDDEPRVLAAITVVVVLFMVAFEQYTLAVAIRSALAPLAAFALQGDALAAGQARFLCILIGVAIGTAFILVLSSQRMARVSERLLKRSEGGEVGGRKRHA